MSLHLSKRAVVFGALSVALSVSVALADSRVALPDSSPAFAHTAKDLGASNPNSIISVTLQLKPQVDLDDALQSLYDPTSSNYHQWLTSDQVSATTSAVSSVRQFLASYNLKVTDAGASHVSAQGRVADMQSAFGVNLHQYQVGTSNLRANSADASVPSQVAAVVSSVSGLSTHRMLPHLAFPTTSDGERFSVAPRALSANGAFFSAQCFRAPQAQTFTSATATATYFGNRYGQDITNQTAGTLGPCGYQPTDLYGAYNLNAVYNAGFDGTGTTVAIVDAYGSKSIQADVATFSEVYGLPAPNLTIIGTPTATPYDADENTSGWAEETTLDVEWVHAIAPGAKIVLIVSVDDNDPNLAAAVASAASMPGVVVVSNSYGGPESTEDAPGFAAFEHANKLNSALGIAVNYSSGDDGDYVVANGAKDVSYPSSSTYATSVGGVSMVLNNRGAIDFQTSWGTNITQIADTAANGNAPIVPPNVEGFDFGGGGGASAKFAKPAFQRYLPGRTRQQPDISWLADPYTGVEIIYTYDDAGDQTVTAIGGTSLACPMFSALWALSTQAAGHKLGQAAPTLYSMDGAAITDVLPPLSLLTLTNVSGVIKSASTHKLTYESAPALAGPLDGNYLYYSAMYNSPFSTRWFVLGFGLDSSLTTGFGWDNATGLGTPNAARFVREAVQLNR